VPPVLSWAFSGPLVFVDEATEDGPALDPLLGEVGDGVVWPGRAELAAAMGSSSVVMGLILGQDGPQVSLAEDKYPVGDLSPGGEHESLRIGIRLRAAGRDLDRFDAGAGQDRIERCAERHCCVEPSGEWTTAMTCAGSLVRWSW
jgi:hypothetical protein